MADEKQSTSALMRRHEQLKRWEESDTNKASVNPDAERKKVKFHDGCVFLAACSSGDTEEVKRLLDRGADINTANVDGLTALHQACIDDNLDMVEFLVEYGADVDVCDNEGWTPLHATASCGFSEIARFLLSIKADIAAVNNDGDLPFDICEDDEMEKLLHEAMDKQGIDPDAERRKEEDMMMADANQWLNSKCIEDKIHGKTGATSLHVASAKGYIKVMNVLLQAGLDINAKDLDGWTPLHAGAHWGQEDACKILAEQMCDMEVKNNAGQTAFDVADTDIIKLLEELKLKQASLKDQHKDLQKDIIQTKLPSSRRRSSVTRMSVEQKQNVMKTEAQERVALDNIESVKEKEEEKVKSSSSSASEEDSSDSETEKINEINNQTSGQNQPRDRDKPPVMTTVEIKPQDMPIIEETTELPEKENLKNNLVGSSDNGIAKVNEVIGDSLRKVVDDKTDKDTEKDLVTDKENIEVVKKDREGDGKEIENEKIKKDMESELIVDKDTEKEKEKDKKHESEKADTTSSGKRGALQRTISAPPQVSEVPKISLNSKPVKDVENDAIPSWRAGLRKTGSTSMVHDSVNKVNEMDKNLPRSASSPRLAEENKKNERDDKVVTRRPFSTDSNNSSSSTDRYGVTSTDQIRGGLSSSPYNRYSSGSIGTGYQRAYVPFYKRQQEQNDRKDKDRAISDISSGGSSNRTSTTPSSLAVTTSPTATSTSSRIGITSPYSTTSSSSNSTPTSPHSIAYRKSFEPPKRDEETEMQRKVRAKRARETRRSTQGVTLEEIKQAEKELKNSNTDKSKMEDSTKLADISERVQDTVDSSRVSGSTADTTLSSSRVGGTTDDKDSTTTISAWRRSKAENSDGTTTLGSSSRDDDSRSSSFRRSRQERDLSSSAPASSFYSTDSTYVPRSQRNVLPTADVGSSSLAPGSGLTRSTSLRTPRVRETEDTTYEPASTRRERERERDRDNSNKTETDKSEEKSDRMSALKRRRARGERRSTGINYTPEEFALVFNTVKNDEEDKDKENKDDSKDDKKSEEKSESGTRFNRFGSASDVPSHISDRTYIGRPTSYTETSRSSASLDKDYKRLYEDEKTEKDKVKRELEQCKRELKDAKSELDRLMRRNELSRTSDTTDKREKRALERKLSELEEEVKKIDVLQEENRRLKEENGALIRVISKLSK